VRRSVGATMMLLPPLAVLLSAQETFGRITLSNGEATLSVFDHRPLERAAQAVATEFGVRLAVEDPPYWWEGDLTESHRAGSGRRVMAPRLLLLEVSLALDNDGQLDDVPALLAALVDRISVERPFDYRIDVGPAGYTLVPTRMRNATGELVPYLSPLDTPVTLARAIRPLAVHANAITEAMEASSGYTVACCTALASNFDLQTQVDFAADREPARHALQRLSLLRREPVVQHMRCQPLTKTCFVLWAPMRQAKPSSVPRERR
jgi:hypothetical protein